MSGLERSPLLTSTQRDPSGRLPVRCKHSAMGTSSQTRQLSMNHSSSLREASTSAGGSCSPVFSSQYEAELNSSSISASSPTLVCSGSGLTMVQSASWNGLRKPCRRERGSTVREPCSTAASPASASSE